LLRTICRGCPAPSHSYRRHAGLLPTIPEFSKRAQAGVDVARPNFALALPMNIAIA
jgi:hypothetical protein